jgi:hypothetical protein
MDQVAELYEFLRRAKRPALFAGAGVSMRVGLPSWHKLLNDAANQIRAADPLAATHIEHCVQQGELLYAATIFSEHPKTTHVRKRQILRDLLTPVDVRSLAALVKLPFGAVFTTNFDRALFDAYAQLTNNAPIDFHYGSASFISSITEPELHVTRLHGRIEGQDPIVFSTGDYKLALSDPAYLDVLRQIFTQRQLLIAGFSFIDPAFQTVLDVIEQVYASRSVGEHVALVPDDAQDSFLAKLSRFNIKQVRYSSSNEHEELWTILEELETALRQPGGAPTVTSSLADAAATNVSPQPLQPIRRFLSSTYARLELHADVETLRDSALEGVVLGLIAGSTDGLTQEDLRKHFTTILGLEDSTAKEFLKRALSNLRTNKLATRKRAEARGDVFIADRDRLKNPLSEALLSLTTAVDGRIQLMFGSRTTSDMRKCVTDTLTTLIETRGWDLGAAFLRGSAPPDIDVDHHVKDAGPFVPLDQLSKISSAVRHLLVFPSPTEAKLLMELGRASFAISLIYSAPRTAISQGSLLPEIIYLDASILLPALVPGHRYHALYNSTVDALAKLVREAGRRVRLVVYEGYLNEVVSHRRKALTELEYEGDSFREYAIRRAKLDGSQNMNVFIGAYAQRAIDDPELTFKAFLEEVAPYTTERDLAPYVSRLGIGVVSKQEIVGEDVADIGFELTKAYAADSDKFKPGIVIEHDAVQLSALASDAGKRKRTLWITADMRLRSKLVGTVLGPIADHVLSHFGLAQLVSFVSNYRAPALGMAGLLWGVRPSEPVARVRDLLISEALEFYDEAYAMEMHELVDGVAERWEREARRREVSLDATDPSSRAEAVRLVGGFQNEFISALNEKIQKRAQE